MEVNYVATGNTSVFTISSLIGCFCKKFTTQETEFKIQNTKQNRIKTFSSITATNEASTGKFNIFNI